MSVPLKSPSAAALENLTPTSQTSTPTGHRSAAVRGPDGRSTRPPSCHYGTWGAETAIHHASFSTTSGLTALPALGLGENVAPAWRVRSSQPTLIPTNECKATASSTEACASAAFLPQDGHGASFSYAHTSTGSHKQLDDRLAAIKASFDALQSSLSEAHAVLESQSEALRQTTALFPPVEMMWFSQTCVTLLRQCAVVEQLVVRGVISEATRRYELQTGLADTMGGPLNGSATDSNPASAVHTFHLPKPMRHGSPERGTWVSGEASVPASTRLPEKLVEAEDGLLCNTHTVMDFAPTAEDHPHDPAATSAAAESPSPIGLEPARPGNSMSFISSLSAIRRFVDLELFLLQQMSPLVSGSVPAAEGGRSASAFSSPSASTTNTTHASRSELPEDMLLSASHSPNARRPVATCFSVPGTGGSVSLPGSPLSSFSSAARSSWHELLRTLSTVWQEAKVAFPIDAHYFDALDFLRTWGPEWYAFELRQIAVPAATTTQGTEVLCIGQGNANDTRATKELYRRLVARDDDTTCFGGVFAKVLRVMEVSGYGCNTAVALSTLIRP